jgi:hypothetical protein
LGSAVIRRRIYNPDVNTFDARRLERPDSSLLKYYVIMSLLTGPGFLVVFWPHFFKYETLRYRFEDDGMSMSWAFYSATKST